MLVRMSTSRMRAAWRAVGALVLACSAVACGSSSGTTTSAVTTVPADCATLATKFNAAMAGFGTTAAPNISTVFDELQQVLPTALRNDAKTLAATFAQLDGAVKTHGGDMAKAIADPAGKAAILAMGSEKNAAANAAIHHYFAIGCTQN
jgi:hypothetical protein